LEIRIWFEYALYYKKDLVVIKRTDGKWTAFHYEITLHFDPDKETDSIKSKTSRRVTPKCGWNEFTDRLFSLKIMTCRIWMT